MSKYSFLAALAGIFSVIVGLMSFLIGTTQSREDGWLYPHMPTIGAYLFCSGLIVLSLLGLIHQIIQYPFIQNHIEKEVLDIGKVVLIILYSAVIFLASSIISALNHLPRWCLDNFPIVSLPIDTIVFYGSITTGMISFTLVTVFAVIASFSLRVKGYLRKIF